MTTHQWQRKKVLDEHDLLLLQAFAEQAAIAKQNAQYFAEANRRMIEITQLGSQLEERNSQLQKRHEVQETLTTISLENKGVEAIIHAFSQMIDAPLTFFNNIEDKFYTHGFDDSFDFDPLELTKKSFQPAGNQFIMKWRLPHLLVRYTCIPFIMVSCFLAVLSFLLKETSPNFLSDCP